MTIQNVMTPAEQPSQNLPAYDAKMLTDGRDQAHILLDDKMYTLRITRSGKLILTK